MTIPGLLLLPLLMLQLTSCLSASPPVDPICVSKDGIKYKDGEKWQSEEDPCTSCECKDGEELCFTAQCMPTCKGAVIVPGTCCDFTCPNSEDCTHKMDLLILVDKSGSIKPWQFIKTKEFLTKLIERLDVRENHTHVALGIFANRFSQKWCFGVHKEKDALLQAVENLACRRCRRGNTATGLAMLAARTVMFGPYCGARPVGDVFRKTILITDGKSTEVRRMGYPIDWVESQAQKLRQTGRTEILAVGVGAFTVHLGEELHRIAGREDNVFTTDDFNKLDGLLDNVTSKTCKAEKVPETCAHKMDLLILLDKSGSIKPWQFEKKKQFITKLIERLDVSEKGTHVALGIFANRFHEKWCFGVHKSKYDVLQEVKYLSCGECRRGNTVTGKALAAARTDMFGPNCGARPEGDVKRLTIVVTDVKSTEEKRLGYPTGWVESQALKLRDTAKTEILAVGVGNLTVDLDQELHNMTGGNEANVFTTDDFNKLDGLLEDVNSQCCKIAADEKNPKHEDCTHKMDVLILADKSGSIKPWQFAKTKEFITKLIGRMDVRENHTHVALGIFAKGFHEKWCFGVHKKKEDVLKQVANLSCPECKRGNTATGIAMAAARTDMFGPNCGARPEGDVKRLTVIVTDGKSTEESLMGYPANWVRSQARLLRETARTEILAVGVGAFKIDAVEELHTIAGDDDNVFTTDDFHTLDGLLNDVTSHSCQPAEKIPEICTLKMDLLFLVDKSGSIEPWHFVKTKQFLTKFIERMDVRENHTHVALGIFANRFHEKWCFDEHTDKDELLQEVENLSCLKCRRGNTATGVAMKAARTDMFGPNCGARTGGDVKRLTVIVTDGKSTEVSRMGKPANWVESQALQLRQTANTEIFAVGVGAFTVESQEELHTITGHQDNVFTADDFHKLDGLLDRVTSESCKPAAA